MSGIKEISIAGAACPEASGTQGGRAVFATARAGIAGTVKALRNRLSANSLREFDDRMLEDIGLSRVDLERSLMTTGMFEDPTASIVRAVRARAWRRFSGRRD